MDFQGRKNRDKRGEAHEAPLAPIRNEEWMREKEDREKTMP